MESMDVYKSFDFEFGAIMQNDRRTMIHLAKGRAIVFRRQSLQLCEEFKKSNSGAPYGVYGVACQI